MEPAPVRYTTSDFTDVTAQVSVRFQASTPGWRVNDPFADNKKKAAEEAARFAKEAARTVRKEDMGPPKTGACGVGDDCGMTISDMEIKCSATKVMSAMIASVSIMLAM